jgi:uncharacterized protein YgiM (DUF1202 family)
MKVEWILVALVGSWLCWGDVSAAWARPAVLRADDRDAQIHLRSAPTTQSQSTQLAQVGDRIEVLRRVTPPTEDYAWDYVRFLGGGQQGWIRADLIEFVRSPAVYGNLYSNSFDARINIRSAPSTQGRILQQRLPGELVQVVRTLQGDGGYDWHYVKFPSGAEGWVREDVLMIWDDQDP